MFNFLFPTIKRECLIWMLDVRSRVNRAHIYDLTNYKNDKLSEDAAPSFPVLIFMRVPLKASGPLPLPNPLDMSIFLRI